MTTNYNIVRSELQKKLAAGNASHADIPIAMEMARKLGGESARVLYAQLKRQADDNAEKFQAGAQQMVKTLEKAENGTESVAEMREVLRQVEQMTAGKDDADSQRLLSDTRKRYQVTRIMSDLPATEQDGEFGETE